jgi:hypothetical protein
LTNGARDDRAYFRGWLKALVNRGVGMMLAKTD